MCLENFRFVEEVKKLEEKVIQANSMKTSFFAKDTKNVTPSFITRFLASNSGKRHSVCEGPRVKNALHQAEEMEELRRKLSTMPQESVVPVPLVSYYLRVYHMFISPTAQHEINITDLQKKRIQEMFKSGNRVPVWVFDEAAEHVLQLIYQNTYRRYVDHYRSKFAPSREPSVLDFGRDPNSSN
jgi:ribosomal protein L39E